MSAERLAAAMVANNHRELGGRSWKELKPAEREVWLGLAWRWVHAADEAGLALVEKEDGR
jgi:hypothetical protein